MNDVDSSESQSHSSGSLDDGVSKSSLTSDIIEEDESSLESTSQVMNLQDKDQIYGSHLSESASPSSSENGEHPMSVASEVDKPDSSPSSGTTSYSDYDDEDEESGSMSYDDSTPTSSLVTDPSMLSSQYELNLQAGAR